MLSAAIHEIPNLCCICEPQLPYLRQYCRQCALPLANTESQCGHCPKHKPSYDESYCAIKYEAPSSGLLTKTKHHQELTCLSTLSSIFEAGFYQYGHNEPSLKPDIIIAIPLSWPRQFRRGFNQSQCLAEIISGKLDIPISNNQLRRVRHTRTQQGLSRTERIKNLQNCFEASSKVEGLKIALFDDVITTGATMESAASVLKQAGAKSVVAWGIARTVY